MSTYINLQTTSVMPNSLLTFFNILQIPSMYLLNLSLLNYPICLIGLHHSLDFWTAIRGIKWADRAKFGRLEMNKLITERVINPPKLERVGRIMFSLCWFCNTLLKCYKDIKVTSCLWRGPSVGFKWESCARMWHCLIGMAKK